MSGINVNNGVINYGGIPSQGAGLLANRPAAGVLGRLFIGTDTNAWYRDTGTAWVTISAGITGSAAAGQVAFWGTATTISGDNGLFWDNTNKRLGIGTITPGVRLDIHGTGIIAQFNGTTTNNAFLDFQNAGSTQWRIGNKYAAAVNSFSIFNAAGTTEVFTILQNGFIGVNTNAPVCFLDVNGGFRVPGIGSNVNPVSNGTNPAYLRFLNTGADYYVGTEGSTAGGFFTGSAAYDSVIYSSTAQNFIIGGVSRMKILTSGFVGIGYTAPAAKLSVSGSVLINTNTANALYELFVAGNLYTGGISPVISTFSTNTAMTRTQTGYVCTATLTLTLPAVSGLNNFYIVVANTGATVTVQRAGSDTILDKLGVSQTSVIVAAGTRSMFYVGGGSITYQIF